MESTVSRKVAVIATGGTVAGVLNADGSGYTPGVLGADEILERAGVSPEETETVQLCNVNSDDITGDIWLEMASLVRRFTGRDDICGVIILHGSDTLEETAYFLSLTADTDKPVVITGSMKPATDENADGPRNICDAVAAVRAPESYGKGAMVCFAGHLFSAGSVCKTSTTDTDAFSGIEIGTVCDGCVLYADGYVRDSRYFDISETDCLPNVSVVYFSVDADPRLLEYAATHSDGIVVAGAGAGEYSIGFREMISGFDVPVVVCSRVHGGQVPDTVLMNEDCISAGGLSPQKAAVLLRLFLAAGC